ncbi:hypothetical protein UJ101_00126 [Flavobacteriaceae bacterium UJ101]|nr:hypothetical protein UJ101_00126 [Flavobacteriaceae bacterium UJ101]
MLNKTLKIIGVVCTIIIVGVLALIYYRGEAYFKDKVNNYLIEKTDGLYQLKYDKIEIGLFDGDIKIHGFNLQFDTIKANQILAKDSTTIFFNIKVKEFDALNFEYKKIFKEEIIQMDELRLNSPKVSTYGTFKEIDTKKSTSPRNHVLKDLFKEININKISLENAGYNIYSKLVKNVKFSNAKRIDILVDQFHSDPSLIEKEQYFDIKDLAIRFLDFESMLGDEIHLLKADTLDFSLKKSYLNVSNLAVLPKHIQKEKDYFKFKIPKAHLKLKKIDLHAFDSLVINDLILKRPQVEYYKNEVKTKKENTSYEQLDELNLYDLIKKDFEKIAIHHLKIDQAKFHYFLASKSPKLIQKVEELDFELNQFSIDSISEKDPNKIFYADSFKIDVHDFQLNLDDQIHEFKIKDFQLSSSKQNVLLKDISIQPIQLKEKMNEKFFLNTDEILIKKIDFKKLYHQKSLVMDELLLSNVKIKDDLYKLDQTKPGDSKLEDVLEPIFNRVQARKVHLQNAIIDFKDFRILNKPGKFKGKINFQLHNLDVDIKRFKENRHVLFSKSFDLNIEDYEFKAPKDVNIYSAKRIELENTTDQVQINNFKIRPEMGGHEALKHYKIASLMNISADQINIKGIDFQKAIFDRELKATLFEINQPTVDIETHKKFKKKNKKFDPKEIEGVFYTALNYMPQIKIDRIEIPNGKIHLKTIDEEQKLKTNIHNDFNIQIDHFLFNEEEMRKTGKEAKVFFSENAIIAVENQTFGIGDGVHKVTADEISFHSNDNSLHVRNALMFPDTNAQKYKSIQGLYQVIIPSLDVTEFDLIKAFETDTVSIGKVSLTEAEINLLNRPKKGKEVKKFNFKNFYLPLPKDVKALKLGELNVKNTIVETYKEEVNKSKPVLKASFEITSDWKNFVLINNGVGKETDFEIDDATYHMKKVHIPLKNKSGLKMDDLKFDVMKGAFKVKNFTFKKEDRIEVDIEEFMLDDLDPEKLYYDDFDVQSIVINRPTIKIKENPNKQTEGKKRIPKIDSINVYPAIENIFNYVKAQSVEIKDANLEIGKLKQSQVNLEFEDVLIDKNYYKDRLLHSKNIILNVHDVHRSSKLYDFGAENITFSTNPSQLEIQNIKIEPTFSKETYHKVMKNQVDRIDAKIDYVKINKIDIPHWIEKEQLFADEVIIGSSELDLFKDKRVPKVAKVKPLPQELLSKIEKEFYVNRLNLKPSSLYYSEYSGNTPKGGQVYLDSLSLMMNNITNISEKLIQNHKAHAHAQALLMGAGRLDVDLEFDLLAEDELQKMKGSLTNFPLDRLNEIVEDAAGIRVREGHTRRLDFDMDLTDKNAIGNVNLIYDSLNIALLDKERIKEQKFLSGLVNLVLNNHSSNRQENKKNVIYLERDDQKSFIGYWWKSILSGVKDSFGFSSKEQREIKKEKTVHQ